MSDNVGYKVFLGICVLLMVIGLILKSIVLIRVMPVIVIGASIYLFLGILLTKKEILNHEDKANNEQQ